MKKKQTMSRDAIKRMILNNGACYLKLLKMVPMRETKGQRLYRPKRLKSNIIDTLSNHVWRNIL